MKSFDSHLLKVFGQVLDIEIIRNGQRHEIGHGPDETESLVTVVNQFVQMEDIVNLDGDTECGTTQVKFLMLLIDDVQVACQPGPFCRVTYVVIQLAIGVDTAEQVHGLELWPKLAVTDGNLGDICIEGQLILLATPCSTHISSAF